MTNCIQKLIINKYVSHLNNCFRSIYHACTWERKKSQLLKEAKKHFLHEYSIDVSRRYGFYVFHNTNNSLIKRGEVYEPEVQQALVTLIAMDKLRNKKPQVFADVGANIGLHTLFLKNIYPELEVIAFDPSPFSWRYLEITLKVNNISKVRLEKIALSDSNGRESFHNWGEESSADSLKNTNRVRGTKPNIIEVQTTRLDDFIVGLPCPTVIKMDCEGAELSILNGAKQSIIKNKPLIMLEVHPINKKAYNVSNEAIFSFLNEMQYTILSLKFEVLDIERFTSMQEAFEENYIIIPNEIISANTDD